MLFQAMRLHPPSLNVPALLSRQTMTLNWNDDSVGQKEHNEMAGEDGDTIEVVNKQLSNIGNSKETTLVSLMLER